MGDPELERLQARGYFLVSRFFGGPIPTEPPLKPIRDVLGQPGWLRALAMEAGLRKLASHCLGRPAFPVSAHLFAKCRGATWFVPWHQDRGVAVRVRHPAPGFAAWTSKDGVPHAHAPGSVLSRMVALRLHLDPCPVEAGALEVVPGSHDRVLTDEDRRRLLEDADHEIVTAEVGDVLVMRPLLLHRSRAPSSALSRRVLHVEYAADPLPAPLAWRYGPDEPAAFAV